LTFELRAPYRTPWQLDVTSTPTDEMPIEELGRLFREIDSRHIRAGHIVAIETDEIGIRVEWRGLTVTLPRPSFDPGHLVCSVHVSYDAVMQWERLKPNRMTVETSNVEAEDEECCGGWFGGPEFACLPRRLPATLVPDAKPATVHHDR
jgi:hypothetical protein